MTVLHCCPTFIYAAWDGICVSVSQWCRLYSNGYSELAHGPQHIVINSALSCWGVRWCVSCRLLQHKVFSSFCSALETALWQHGCVWQCLQLSESDHGVTRACLSASFAGVNTDGQHQGELAIVLKDGAPFIPVQPARWTQWPRNMSCSFRLSCFWDHKEVWLTSPVFCQFCEHTQETIQQCESRALNQDSVMLRTLTLTSKGQFQQNNIISLSKTTWIFWPATLWRSS